MRSICGFVGVLIACAAIGCGSKDEGAGAKQNGDQTANANGEKPADGRKTGGNAGDASTKDAADGIALPGDPNSIMLTPDNTEITFQGVEDGGNQQGGFKTVAGNIALGKDGKPTAIDVTIETNSLHAADEELANQLKSGDFFEVSTFPKVSLMSSKIEPSGDGDATHELTAELNLRGVTKEFTIPLKVESSQETFALTTEFTISGKEFGFAAKPKTIGDAITIKIEIDASRN